MCPSPSARPEESREAAPHTRFRGGTGLVSTASDYLHFAMMMLGNGVLEGTRILSRKTLELMTANHLRPERMPYEIQGMYSPRGALRAGSTDDHESRPVADTGVGRCVRLVRRSQHPLLGGSAGAADRDPDGSVPAEWVPRDRERLSRGGLSGHRGLAVLARPQPTISLPAARLLGCMLTHRDTPTPF
jgi:CubicO group peptidase (beta-lactamase class C family)